MVRLKGKKVRIYYRNNSTMAIAALKKGYADAAKESANFMYTKLKQYFTQGGTDFGPWVPAIRPSTVQYVGKLEDAFSHWKSFREAAARKTGKLPSEALIQLAARGEYFPDYGKLPTSAPLTQKEARMRREGVPPLGGTSGRIFRGIVVRKVKEGQYEVESTYLFSAVHEFGMKIKVPPGTGKVPPMIRKLWSLGFAASPHLEFVNIPARPFMGPATAATRIQFPYICRKYVTQAMREFLPPITGKGVITEWKMPAAE